MPLLTGPIREGQVHQYTDWLAHEALTPLPIVQSGSGFDTKPRPNRERQHWHVIWVTVNHNSLFRLDLAWGKMYSTLFHHSFTTRVKTEAFAVWNKDPVGSASYIIILL